MESSPFVLVSDSESVIDLETATLGNVVAAKVADQQVSARKLGHLSAHPLFCRSRRIVGLADKADSRSTRNIELLGLHPYPQLFAKHHS
jgi:hypothetical protein